MLIIMITSGVFNPATMNPASIILPTLPSVEHFSNSNSFNYIDIIILIIFFILIVLVYLRTTNKI
jgi:hypothetical protein